MEICFCFSFWRLLKMKTLLNLQLSPRSHAYKISRRNSCAKIYPHYKQDFQKLLSMKTSLYSANPLKNSNLMIENWSLVINLCLIWTCTMIDPIKCSHFIPPKNTKNPLVFWCFHGVQNESINQKWITTDLVHLIVPFIVKRNLHVSFLTLFIDVPFILIFF